MCIISSASSLSLEIFHQVSGQIILLLTSSTGTPTTGGLEKMFEKSSFNGIPAGAMLILSTLWSIRSCFTFHMKAMEAENPFFPMTSKLMVYISAALTSSKRVLMLVFYFCPFLGHFSLLFHWKYQQKGY